MRRVHSSTRVCIQERRGRTCSRLFRCTASTSSRDEIVEKEIFYFSIAWWVFSKLVQRGLRTLEGGLISMNSSSDNCQDDCDLIWKPRNKIYKYNAESSVCCNHTLHTRCWDTISSIPSLPTTTQHTDTTNSSQQKLTLVNWVVVTEWKRRKKMAFGSGCPATGPGWAIRTYCRSSVHFRI